ncbi:MAG: 2-oxoglutarate dehydrogenase complex dihydrolipoyllysine-residue succinyltransferase [Candidatus Eisenbacteria bacterium]|uniref:Dihydrolipoyllysine-residue succinyltransferase component of 2-oxoglutarate dehydrogenase complex n=1 Tax=Eiseniibacteriota bacterium TaxID=2212470 RepID=A0A9D6QP49_UNCEI|nr:2-oxoglutarate dehydrogenase complex dihydrolipoyllysine-residue succinyltransferase [Candidatus Eisenbacteria bacterium]MBI3539589.1 2-oxoglutarate dehydrogenase complex dihydrolipoyllysine-residue succinyltransferase [Candidatus Eisenbacteria bacterium]
MMREIKVPRLAESVSEGVVVAWLKPDGASVAVDEPVVTLETDKAAVEIPSEFAGVLHHGRALGDRVEVGDVLARVDEGAAPAKAATPSAAEVRPPAVSETTPTLSPAVRRLVEEHGLDPATIAATGPGGRLLKEDVQRHMTAASPAPATGGVLAVPTGAEIRPPIGTNALAPQRAPTDWRESETERAVPMSRIRLRIAERLVKAQQTAAILTTFNEVDMSAVMALRERHRDEFVRRHGVRLSYMSFFTRACVLALERLPELNAEIRGSDIVYRRHVHMGIAVGTDRGLVVPVVRDADRRSFPDLEREIARLSAVAREGTVSLDDLSGGTFTISNGGVYGSLLSTPILNFPQSGILGMHKIQKRPVVVDDQMVIRPMMYLALSYDHRIVDGEQAVTFLIGVRDRLEDPERMLVEL